MTYTQKSLFLLEISHFIDHLYTTGYWQPLHIKQWPNLLQCGQQ